MTQLARLSEDEIYRTQDSFGPVVVLEYGGMRVLSFDSPFEQSAMRLDKPLALVHEYSRAMLLVLLFKEPMQATLLGLGGGALLRALHQQCEQTHFQVIELREAVIDIATQYFSIPNDERIVIHHGNGFEYLNYAPKQSSDMIFADMYQANAMEPLQGTSRFLRQCWQLLTPDGWLVINFHQFPSFNEAYMQKMYRLFPEVMYCSTSCGNHVVICGKQRLELPLSAYREPMQALEQRFEVRLSRYFEQMVTVNMNRLIE